VQQKWDQHQRQRRQKGASHGEGSLQRRAAPQAAHESECWNSY
jgi:hypothetical protein